MEIKTTPLSPGELFDRFTIVLRKAMFNPSAYGKQLEDMCALLQENGLPAELISAVCHLQMHNTDIWNLESDIRLGKEGQLGDAEVGKRALKIRDINNKRVALVNKLNELFGDARRESKFNHASE